MDFMLLLILLWEDAILERSEKIFPQAETFWREEIKSSFWVVSIHLDKTMLSAWPFNTLHFLLPSPFVHELPPVVPIMSCPPSLYCSPLAVITAQSFSQLLFHDHPTICVLLVPPLGELPSFTRAVFLSPHLPLYLTQAQNLTAFPTPRISQCHWRFTLSIFPEVWAVIILHFDLFYSLTLSFFSSFWNSGWKKNSLCSKHVPNFLIFRSLLTINFTDNIQTHHPHLWKSYPSFKPSSTL